MVLKKLETALEWMDFEDRQPGPVGDLVPLAPKGFARAVASSVPAST